MSKVIRISGLLMLCGLVMFTMLSSVVKVHANTPNLRPIQVQNTGYTDSRGTINVSATCPQNYRAQNGAVQITMSGQTPDYGIRENGPSLKGDAWVTTIENKVTGSLTVTVTVTCVAR